NTFRELAAGVWLEVLTFLLTQQACTTALKQCSHRIVIATAHSGSGLGKFSAQSQPAIFRAARLNLPQMSVHSTDLQQRRIGYLLDDPPFLHYKNAVGIDYRS